MENINNNSVDTSQDAATSEVSVENNIGKSVEQPILSKEEKLTNIEEVISNQETQIAKLAESNKNTETALKDLRKELGLPEVKEKTPSILSGEDKIKELQDRKKGLESQKKEIVSQQEKEKLIKIEKEKILQEKINELFKEFENLQASGKLEEVLKGEANFESKSMGTVSPENVKALAKVFQEGIKLLPEILKNLPDLLKQFDKDLEKEANDRVDKKLEEEKQKSEELQEKEEKPEETKQEEELKATGNEALYNEVKPEAISMDSISENNNL